MSTDKKTVLIAEDDKSLREILAQNLEKMGVRVVTANDGKELMTILKKTKADLLVLDIWMPKMNGYKVLEEIKENDKLKGLKILVLTNLGINGEVADKVKKLGASECCLKANMSIKEVTDKVKEYL